MTALAISIVLIGIGSIIGLRVVRRLAARIERMEAIVADVRPDLLALPPRAPQLPAIFTQGRVVKCGIQSCNGRASPTCPALSCAKHCQLHCPSHV